MPAAASDLLNRRQLLGLVGSLALASVASCAREESVPREPWQQRLIAGRPEAPARIGFLGDSITFGAGAPPYGNSLPKYQWCYPGQLRSMLQSDYGDAGTGWVLMNQVLWPVTETNRGWDSRITVVGTVDKLPIGPFGRACFSIPAGSALNPESYVEFAVTGTTLSTLVIGQPQGNSHQLVSVDDAAPVSLANVVGGTGSDLAPRHGPNPAQLWTDVPLSAVPYPHKVRIWGSGGPVDLVAVRGSTGAGSIEISTVAVSGASLSSFIIQGRDQESSGHLGLPWIDTFGFDLLVVALGTNDYNAGRALADTRGRLTEVIDRQRRTGGDVAVLFPPISSPKLYRGAPAPTYTDYQELYAEVTTAEHVPLIDLTRLWGADFAASDARLPPKYADHSLHPSDDGAHDIALKCREFLAL